MSTPVQGFREIDYVVKSVMADYGEDTLNNYSRYLKWAIDCYNDLLLYRFDQVKTVELEIKNNLTVDLPEDYVKYIAIGVYINGKLWTMTRRPGMQQKDLEDCQIPFEVVNQDTAGRWAGITPYGYLFGGSFRNGQYVGEQFAYGGGWNSHGYYNVDITNRRIEFSNVVAGKKIVLEYIANGIDCNGSAQIPFASVPVFTSYVHWKKAEFDRKESAGEKERKRNLYYIEYNKYTHLTTMFTVNEFLDSKYRTIRMTPKR